MRPTARIKNLVRPLVFAARQAGWRLRGLARRPVRWNGKQDPVLLRFAPWSGEADGRFAHDFLGARTDPRFRPQIRPDPPGPLATEYPVPQYEYLELVFVLEAIAGAENEALTVMELGAGYGRWLVTAHRAALRLGLPAPRLIGVEMTPRHFGWLGEHLTNNGVDPSRRRLIHAAVSDRDGEAWFQPEPDPSSAYGHRVFRRRGGARAPENPAPPPDALEPVRVPCLRLRDLLRSERRIDLIHCDIQGEELRALGDARAELGRRVGRLVVGTHSRHIHRRLRSMLRADGWRLRWDFGLRSLARTPYGDVRFLDGLLAAVNPRRAGQDQKASRTPS
jgi:FkbM family methyltransferase